MNTAALRDVALDDPAIEMVGALDIVPTETGITPRRLPSWTRPQIPDLFVDTMVGLASGVRLRFRTDSPVIELDVLTTSLHLLPEPRRANVFDLVDGDHIIAMAGTSGHTIVVDSTKFPDGGIDFVAGDAETICFDGLEPELRDVEIWLPQGANVDVRALRVHPDAVVAPATTRRARWVHYGSSISHCMEADRPTGIWPAVAALGAGVDLVNLGLAGQCHLDPFVARTIRDLDIDAISVKVGINVINADSMRERVFTPALHGFLDTVREGHPTTPIIVISPIVCPVAEDHPGPTGTDANGACTVVPRPDALAEGALTLRRVREIIAAVVDARRALGDTNLHYVDGLTLFGPDDAAGLPDGLHPDAAGYRLMGERFAPIAFGAGAPFAGLTSAS